MTTFLDAVVEAVQRPGRYNAAEYARPSAILWPDGGREWEPLLPLLRGRLALVTLGDYEPTTRTGPSHWVRCMLARTLDDRLPAGEIPVLYMPGISKQDIRAVEDCPPELQPIASLQYEGALFTQLNERTGRFAIHRIDRRRSQFAFEERGGNEESAARVAQLPCPISRLRCRPSGRILRRPAASDQARSV